MDSLTRKNFFRIIGMTTKVLLIPLITFFSFVSEGTTLIVPLDSSTVGDTTLSTGVWNVASQELHPKIQIENWNSTGLTDPIPLNVGDGSDGPFDSNTYANFGTVSGNTIAMNTGTYNFTNFHLAANYVIVPVGSGPLTIRSQSNVIVETGAGINCSGEDGQNTKQRDSGGTSPALGGSGRCGGGDGGDGYQATSGTGTSGGAGVTGGSGALATTSAVTGGRGGGGGGGVDSSYQGSGVTTGQSAAGQDGGSALNGTEITGEVTFRTDLGIGGSGGGAGGAYAPAVVDGFEGTGGGGGGGGGTVVIHAVGNINLVDVTSFIAAFGGSGGAAGDGNLWSTPGTGLGGAGGGGAGGTIWLAAGNQISDSANLGSRWEGLQAVQRYGGGGDADSVGADGSFGRIWATDVNCTGTAAGPTNCPLSPDPYVDLTEFGSTRYQLGNIEFYSKAIDLNNTGPELVSLTVSSTVPAQVTTMVQASDDGSFASTSGEVAASQISTLSGHRFIRVHITINNNNATTPVKVTGITLDYTPQNTTKFEFVSACGRIDTPWYLILFALFLVMVPSNILRFRFRLKS